MLFNTLLLMDYFQTILYNIAKKDKRVSRDIVSHYNTLELKDIFLQDS